MEIMKKKKLKGCGEFKWLVYDKPSSERASSRQDAGLRSKAWSKGERHRTSH